MMEENQATGYEPSHRLWQSIQTVGVSACVISILDQKMHKMVKCTSWYQLTWVVPDKV